MRLSSIDSVRFQPLSLRLMLEILIEEGLPTDPLLIEVGITRRQLADMDFVITGRQELDISSAFFALTRDRSDIWMKVARKYHLLALDPAGMAIVTAPTFGHALSLICAYQELSYSLTVPMLIEQGRRPCGVELSFAETPPDIIPYELARDGIGYLLFINTMWCGQAPLTRIEAPRYIIESLSDIVRDIPFFDTEHTRFYFDPASFDQPLPNSNAYFHAMHVDKLNAKLAALLNRDSIAARIRAFANASLPSAITLSSTAGHLGMSVRTIQRRLEDEQTSLRDIVNEVRIERTKELLRTSGISMEAIAEAVGYSSSSALSHGFMRITGTSPTKFRR